MSERMGQKPSEKEQAKIDEIDKITSEVNYKRYHPDASQIPDKLFGGEPNEFVEENANLKKQLAQYEDDRAEKIEAYERLYDENEKLKKEGDEWAKALDNAIKKTEDYQKQIKTLNAEVKKLKTSNTKLKKALTDDEPT